MFDAVRSNKRIVQILLGLIAVTFSLWGIESYIQNWGRDTWVAKVGGAKISQQEFQEALRAEQDRLRQQLGAGFDPAMLERPEFRNSVVERLVGQKLLELERTSGRIKATAGPLRDTIAEAFVEDGSFSPKRYEQFLAARGMSAPQFEHRVAQDLAQQQLVTAVGQSVLVPKGAVAEVIGLRDEVREVALWLFPSAQFAPSVKLADDAARKDYDANPKAWEMPERAKVEYVVLSLQGLAASAKVDEAAARQQFDAHPERYNAPEDRRARHILIEAPKDATTEQRAAARQKAEALLKSVKAKPETFADLAKSNSQDPGSAANGGDLGFFARGAMVKPFEDAAYALKPGQISGIVESDFGFHIIKLEEVRGGGARTFDEVKAQVLEELRREAATKRFAEVADSFGNTVYEQPDALKPVAEKYGLTLQQSDWIGRDGSGATGPLANPKVLAAVFAAESIRSQRNTEAIDLGDSTLVSARVIEHKPATVRPFEEVKVEIEQRLAAKEAGAQAALAGKAAIEKLRAGQNLPEAKWSEPAKLSRATPGPLSPEAAKAVFRLATDKLPAFTGVELGLQGYLVARVSSVQRAAPAADDPRAKMVADQYARMVGQEDLRAYVAALRARHKVVINKALVESKEQ